MSAPGTITGEVINLTAWHPLIAQWRPISVPARRVVFVKSVLHDTGDGAFIQTDADYSLEVVESRETVVGLLAQALLATPRQLAMDRHWGGLYGG